jgi:polyisoprenoid-binding protein YceI
VFSAWGCEPSSGRGYNLRLWQVIGVVFWSTLASAQTTTFQIDPGRSEVTFTLGDVLHTVHGTFHVSDTEVKFDRKTSTISGEINVSANSGKSGNNTRDRRMSKDVLEAEKFAAVSFKPQQMSGNLAVDGDSTVEVSGILTVHGSSHPLKVPVMVHVQNGGCTAKTHFVIPYVEWGMKDPSTFVLRVAKEVSIDLTLVGRMEDSR